MKHFFGKLEPIRTNFIPVSLAKIKAIESRIGTLPDDYLKFIRTFGGCGFSSDAIVKRSDGKGFPIFTFFGNEEDSIDLEKALSAYPDLKDDGKLPFADDMMGNPYILDPQTGEVFFIVFSQGLVTAYRIANSFTDFLDMIVVNSDSCNRNFIHKYSDQT